MLASDITTNAATVILRDAASSFARLDTLADNQGRFEIHDGRNFDTLGDLANAGQIVTGTGSVLTVNGAYTQTGSGSSIDVAGVLDVTAGTPTIADKATLSGEGVLTGPFEIGLDGGADPTNPTWTFETSGAPDWDVCSLVVSVDTVGNRVFLLGLEVATGRTADFDGDGDVDGDDFLAVAKPVRQQCGQRRRRLCAGADFSRATFPRLVPLLRSSQNDASRVEAHGEFEQFNHLFSDCHQTTVFEPPRPLLP